MIKKKQQKSLLKLRRREPLSGQIKKFLESADNPDAWRQIADPKSGLNIKLSTEEVNVIKRLYECQFADETYDPHSPSVDFFTYKKTEHKVNSHKRPKTNNEKSRWEAKRIAKIIKGIRRGSINIRDILEPGWRTKILAPFIDVWAQDSDVPKSSLPQIHAPKQQLPGHRDSYNPAPEYLPDEKERSEWEARDPKLRNPYLPTRYSSMRQIPAYSNLVSERFSRCLDLYMCPRAMKERMTVEHSDDLLPVLPDPSTLKPFPENLSLEFVGHTKAIIAISLDSSGQWLLSASKDSTVKLWEVSSGQCLHTWSFTSSNIATLSWNPIHPFFAIALDDRIEILLPPGIVPGSKEAEDTLFQDAFVVDLNSNSKLSWSLDKRKKALLLKLDSPATWMAWHRRGDYLATLHSQSQKHGQRLFIHQISRRASQSPLSRLLGTPRACLFHPSQPKLTVLTDMSLRIYDLSKQKLAKKLRLSAKHPSYLTLHPSGDHIVVAHLDGSLLWYDLNGSDRPHRKLQQGSAIRASVFSNRFNLLASCTDAGFINIMHASIDQEDYSKDPLIVPVKVIATNGGGLNSMTWHPSQPWLLVGSENGTISIFV